MTATFYIKQNDTSPAIEFQLDPVVDLTGATVVFNMAQQDGTAKISRGVASVVGAAADGIVKYDWSDGDTDTAGTFFGEFEVTYSDGSIETFPNADNIAVVITSDLG